MRLFMGCALVFLVALGCVSVAQTLPEARPQILLSFAPIVKNSAPAVVNVYSSAKTVKRDNRGLFTDPFFRHFFGGKGNFGRPRERVQNSLGSGVIVDPSGIIVTNNHVILTGTDVRVVLADKREFEASVLLADGRTDLAVLKIDVGEEELTSLSFGDSDDLEVGDLVLAIGNPFGVGQTVTSGIVSALARTQVGISDYQFFIQTDAAINPGNSGGALVNMAGELVGINTAIFSRSGGSIGIGFSIPSNMVQTVVQSAATGKPIRRPWTGADLQDVTADIANSLGFARPEGAMIANLHPLSPLLPAGLKQGDVILAVDGRPVENAREFNYRLATAKIGDLAIIEFYRGGKSGQTSMKLIAAPDTGEREKLLVRDRGPLQGVIVADLSPALAEELGVSANAKGVIIAEVQQGQVQRFFKKGDILLLVNGQAIATVDELKRVFASGPGSWDIQISRNGRKLQLTAR